MRIESNPITDIVYQIDSSNSEPIAIKLPLPSYSTLMPEFLSYELVLISFQPLIPLRLLQSTQDFPSFISQYPTNEITIVTTDSKLAGMYTFKLVAFDTFSEIRNDEIMFIVTLNCYMTGLRPIYSSRTIKQTIFTIGGIS